MDLSNTNRGMKRSAGKFENEASTSKKNLISNYNAIGATFNAGGYTKVCIDNINVHQNIHHQQPTPQQPPRAIDFQVTDPITSFYGRDELFQHVKNAFNEPKNDKPYNLVAVCGYGGIGKTEFARKYIKNNRADFENTIWISAEFESKIHDSFNKLLSELKGRGYRCYSHQDVYNYLNNNKTIFVFDNAENMKSIRSFLPIKSNDSLFLITSQVRTWIPYKSFELNKLDLKSATNIINNVLTTHRMEISDCQLQTFVNIVEPIPLVLQIEAGFVCHNILERKRIGKEYNMDNILQTLNTRSEFETQEFPDFSHDSYGKSVFASLSRTLDKLWGKQDKASKLITKILGLSAYLSADNIEQHTLKEILRIDDEELFQNSLFTLVEFSLFKVSYYISIHRTVQECVRYYCRTKLNSDEYYLLALCLLLNDDKYYYMHQNNAILQHHENSYLETFLTFYDANKCSTLDCNLGKYISYQLLKLVVAKLNLIINPEFLCEAIIRERDDIKQLLLDNGADFNVVDNQGFNTLYYACLPHDDDGGYYFNSTLSITWGRIQPLIKSGVDANSKNLKGNTIFHNLCNLGKNDMGKDEYIFELCVLMIAVGGDPEIENEEGQKPADLARKYKLTRTLQLLDRSISEYKYSLHIAAELRQFEFLGSLARDKVYDMNMRDDSGRTILHVLAGLTQLDAKNEIKLLYNTAALLLFYEANVSIKNNEMKTAADVARRCKREKMADFFSSQVPPGIILFKSAHRIKIEHFQLVSTEDEKFVNEQDNTGCTLLHALCGLDINNDPELELDIIKLAANIVIEHYADVWLKNYEKETAAQVARRQGRLMLADFLDFRAGNFSVETVWRDDKWDKDKGDDFMYIAIKYYNFDLIKHTWWKYCLSKTGSSTEGFPDQSAFLILRMLCGYEDLSVTDATLIRVFDDLDLRLLAEYDADQYHEAIEIAQQHRRDELAVWMTRIRFPFKRPEILKLWIQAIRRNNWSPSKTSRICGMHFVENDFQIRPGCSTKLLKPDAVPSVFSFPKHLQKNKTSRRILTRNTPDLRMNEMDINEIPSSSSEPLTLENKLVDAGTQTLNFNSEFHLRRKIKTLKQKVRRRDITITKMKDVIKLISEKGYSNENLDSVLKNYFQGFPLELVLHQKNNEAVSNPGQRRYSDLMKQFAHTLYFYSPKAYNFLRQHLILPNGRTIRKWLSKRNCQPGFLLEVMEFLKEEVIKNPELKQCALIIDGMAIRKQVLWDHTEGKFTGNVDYGGVVDVDFEMAASEALFFQIVSYSKHFKCPVGYFLINKADANLQTQLITSCLRMLSEVHIMVRSITSDGTKTNIATYCNLGCDLFAKEIVYYFRHPSAPINVYCMLDIAHMLKLGRNTFAEKQLTSNSGVINWEYIKKLDEIQEKEQLRFANSLTSNHVYYKNKIMNVRLAAQALSSGVADAIQFLKEQGVKEFEDSSATIEFIRIIDKIFDILNSRNPFGKGYKAPIKPITLRYFEDVFSEAITYLKSLSITGVPILNHNRKTFALGFILTMKSTLGLAKELFTLDENPFKYFLTYKCSQDHLELFFSCIRSRGGWNNNPNSQQLKWSLRQLLFKNSVASSINSNCADFLNFSTPSLEFRSDSRSKIEIINDNEEVENINNLIKSIGVKSLSDFQDNIIYYIAGFVVRSLLKKNTCQHCINILLFKPINNTIQDHLYCASQEGFKQFTNSINRGGLLYASDIVHKIVYFIEKQFRRISENEILLKNKINLKNLLQHAAISHFLQNLDNFQPKHPIVEEFLCEDLHEVQMVKNIVNIFLKCRMHHHANLLNLKLHGKSSSIRQKMTKLVLFKNC